MPDLDTDAQTVAHLAVALYRATYGTGDDLGTPADHVDEAVALLEKSRAALIARREAADAAVRDDVRTVVTADVPRRAPDAAATNRRRPG